MTDDPDLAPHPHLAYAVVTYRDGVPQVQHFGEAHVVPGSEQIIDAPINITVALADGRSLGSA